MQGPSFLICMLFVRRLEITQNRETGLEYPSILRELRSGLSTYSCCSLAGLSRPLPFEDRCGHTAEHKIRIES